MELTTPIEIPPSTWKIEPCERMLFVGSCFADNMGQRFAEQQFRTVVNPYGVMYNPASILHTVQRLLDEGGMPFAADEPGTAVFTLGTNHVYILRETGEIVDNCRKRPQSLFEERELTVEECLEYLSRAISLIHSRFPQVRFILTVSPIRYKKYGFHGSQLSKATLLLAVSRINKGVVTYFPSYEIMNDELRDYRFYKEDMLHPTDQAVDYIYQRMADTFFSDATRQFLKEWEPIRAALHHRPFNAASEEYKAFMKHTMEQAADLKRRFPSLQI
jgi:hypothetical protein